MENKIGELINIIKETNSNNNIILVCTIVSCFIALLTVIISIYIFLLQIKDRVLTKMVLGYIYSYFSPAYTIDKLPTTDNIQKNLKSVIFSKKDILDTIIYLNKENLIEAVGDLSTNLQKLKWKPNVKYWKKNNYIRR